MLRAPAAAPPPLGDTLRNFPSPEEICVMTHFIVGRATQLRGFGTYYVSVQNTQ